MCMTLEKEGHRLVLVRERDGERREVEVGEDALGVAQAFGFEDDPGAPENEAWARAFSYLHGLRSGESASVEGSLGFGPERTPGHVLDEAVQRFLEGRETLALLDDAAPALGRLLAGHDGVLDGFDAAHEALRELIREAKAEMVRVRDRLGRLTDEEAA